MPEALTPAIFEATVGTEFTIDLGDGNLVRTTLASVERHSPRSHGERTEPFSLTFVGPEDRPLPQATYVFDHAEVGRLDIFIVPIGPDADGRQRYEAVFNWDAFHPHMDRVLAGPHEADSFVQANRPVPLLDVQRDRQSFSIRIGHDAAQERGADALVAVFGLEGDVDDAELVRSQSDEV